MDQSPATLTAVEILKTLEIKLDDQRNPSEERLSYNVFLATSFLQRLSHNVFLTTSFIQRLSRNVF